jgi:DNA-binding response OmpR family regulator
MTKRLLVIDDQPEFARFVARVARLAGYDPEAITESDRFFEAFGRVDPDVVVLDVVMPGIDGIELVQWLAEVKCRARIVIVSGYNPSYARMAEVMAKARGILSVTVLAKPVAVDDLRAAIDPPETVSTIASESAGPTPP